MKKILGKILIVWKDPVWSKVIASGIIFIIAFIWTKYSNYSLADLWNYSLLFLSFRIPIYSVLAIVGVLYIIRMLIIFFKSKHDIGSEPMGHFTFKELYLILQNQNLPVGTVGMGFSGTQPPQENLLGLFQMYSPIMNTGVTLEYPRDDGGYLYGVLCPKLIGYGLIDKIETENKELRMIEIKYQTSELGKKFYSFVEKVTHLNPKRK